jgi:hypothetical protein
MPFRRSQFGRFGPQAMTLLQLDPAGIAASATDAASARLLGTETPAAHSNLTTFYWLAERGFLPNDDQRCHEWNNRFAELLRANPEIRPLKSNHMRCEPVCAHDFIPSTQHRPLYGWFNLDSLVAFGSAGVPLDSVSHDGRGVLSPTEWQSPTGPVMLLWIMDEAGEILVGPEEGGHIKHSSIAAGHVVFAGGEIGFRQGKIRVVNLKTGHYLPPGQFGYKTIRLSPFVAEVFREYDRIFLQGQGLVDFDILNY